AIPTFKSHFIAILSSVDNLFPINKWDCLFPQAILTLNLLQNSDVMPKTSAYVYHHGPFNYDRMPLAPLGHAIQFHIKPGCCCPWGEHSTNGWYIAAHHHIFFKATCTHSLSNTMYFKHNT
ncbi:hypothetical protein ACHAW6_008569, partial [Cyclotella cf. meneghiniana]